MLDSNIFNLAVLNDSSSNVSARESRNLPLGNADSALDTILHKAAIPAGDWARQGVRNTYQYEPKILSYIQVTLEIRSLTGFGWLFWENIIDFLPYIKCANWSSKYAYLSWQSKKITTRLHFFSLELEKSFSSTFQLAKIGEIDPLQPMTQRGQAIQGKFQTPILSLRFLDPLKYLTKIDLTKLV